MNVKVCVRAALAGCFAVILAIVTAVPAVAADPQERQIGDQVYRQLASKGQIIFSSPWYRVLNPIGRRISSVADPQYDWPFHFLLVHQNQPNAFAVPGGNIYVTDALMKFVQNQEELAGVLCHETSHDIHHDVMNLIRKNQQVGLYATIGSLLLGGTPVVNALINNIAGLESLNFSRKVEAAADEKGAYTCAQAGENPWGMVWLFQNFEKADTGNAMEMLSDHPTDAHRIADLEHLFASHPEVFGRYHNDIYSATPMPSYSSLVRQGPGAPIPGYET